MGTQRPCGETPEAAAISLTAAVIVVVYQALRADRADAAVISPTAPPG
jgi:hypothetical protein